MAGEQGCPECANILPPTVSSVVKPGDTWLVRPIPAPYRHAQGHARRSRRASHALDFFPEWAPGGEGRPASSSRSQRRQGLPTGRLLALRRRGKQALLACGAMTRWITMALLVCKRGPWQSVRGLGGRRQEVGGGGRWDAKNAVFGTLNSVDRWFFTRGPWWTV